MTSINTHNTIIKVRLERGAVRYFPFDVFYFVCASCKTYLPRIFPWSLCLPFTHNLYTAFRNVWNNKIGSIEGMEHPNDARRIPLDTDDIDWIISFIQDEERKKDCFVLVPILALWQKHPRVIKSFEKYSRQLAYFTAPQHEKPTDNKFENILTDDAVLFTPQGPIRPICKVCPNSIKHLRNECSLGNENCRTLLTILRSPDEQLQDNKTRSSENSYAFVRKLTPLY